MRRVDMSNSRHAVRRVEFLHIGGAHMSYGLGTLKVFDALAAGGKVTIPIQPAFWAKTWGMLVDKFGTPWIVNGELLPI